MNASLEDVRVLDDLMEEELEVCYPLTHMYSVHKLQQTGQVINVQA